MLSLCYRPLEKRHYRTLQEVLENRPSSKDFKLLSKTNGSTPSPTGATVRPKRKGRLTIATIALETVMLQENPKASVHPDHCDVGSEDGEPLRYDG